MANIKERNISLEVTNITPKQWANLVIELNLIATAWRPFGPKIKLKTKNFERLIKWGRRRSEDSGKNKRSRPKMGPDEELEI